MTEPDAHPRGLAPRMRQVFGHVDFWRSLIAQILGTLIGGFFAVQIALGWGGFVTFNAWDAVFRVVFIVLVIIFAIGLLFGWAVGMSLLLRPVNLKLKDRYWLNLLWGVCCTFR